MLPEPSITFRITNAAIMLSAIRFDDELCPQMHKIHYIWPNRLLSTEFLTIEAMGT